MVKKISETARKRAWESAGGRCWYCGNEIHPMTFQCDHVVPQALGGKNKDNLVAACPPCNRAKGKLTVEDYRLRIQRRIAGVPYFNAEQIQYLREQGFEIPSGTPWIFWFERGQDTEQ